MAATNALFLAIQRHLDEDSDIREKIRPVVRNIEQLCRNTLAVLQGIHAAGTDVAAICASTREQFALIRAQLDVLRTTFPPGDFFRFNDHWKFVTQQIVFLVALLVYLEREALIGEDDLRQLFNVSLDDKEPFHIVLEDFLIGLCNLSNELTRVAMNAVTAGDYGRPVRISRFMGDFHSGFRLLNLKNDALRKRYDGLKYDMKRIEEIVYDLKIRNLLPQA